MCNLLIFLTFFVFGLVFHCGNAKFECPVPPKSSLIYFDLEALNSLAIQQGYHNAIHSPLLCVKGQDEECSKQQCCPGEKGCCLSSLGKEEDRHIRKCGCKKPLDDKCTFPAPYAILANSECTVQNNSKISACLRERREDEYLAKQDALRTKNKSNGQADRVINPLEPAFYYVTQNSLNLVTDITNNIELSPTREN